MPARFLSYNALSRALFAMNRHSLSTKAAAVSLLTVAIWSLNSFAKPEDAAKNQAPKAASIAPPIPLATATPTAQSEMAQAEPEARELSLLEIFPVQEPLAYRKNQSDAAPDEAIIAAKAAAGEVWVNSNSKVFHKPGTTYYGKTKKGFFLPETEAIKKGYRGIQGQ